MTHHAPSLQGTSSSQHTNNPWGSAFATDVLSQIPKSSGINSWIFGHTHTTPRSFNIRGYESWQINGDMCFPGRIQRGQRMRLTSGKSYMYDPAASQVNSVHFLSCRIISCRTQRTSGLLSQYTVPVIVIIVVYHCTP